MMAARRTHSSLLFLFVVGAAGPLVRSAHAQDSSAALSATLLRRLAEAVDAQRTNRPVWVVIHREFPHEVVGVFEQLDLASTNVRPGYLKLGPFLTPIDSGTSTVMYGIVECPGEHDPMSQCPDTTFAFFSAAMPQQDVDSVVVTIYGRRPPIRRQFKPTQVDAVFFTLSAIDKFVVPYYTRLYGPARAARMRQTWLRKTH